MTVLDVDSSVCYKRSGAIVDASQASKYLQATVPYPYTSREAYERSLRVPIGPEYNTDEAFRNLTRPAVSVMGWDVDKGEEDCDEGDDEGDGDDTDDDGDDDEGGGGDKGDDDDGGDDGDEDDD